MHPHDEDFLVVRTVEDADPPALGQVSDVAPHEVVVELLRRGLLERGHLAPLRIDAGHDVFDRAVFASRVHRLEHKQQGPAVLGVKDVLLFRQPRNAALEEVRGVALVQLQAAGVPRIEVLEAEAFAFGDTERVDVFLYTIEDFLSRHAPPPFVKAQSTLTGSWAQRPLIGSSFATAHELLALLRRTAVPRKGPLVARSPDIPRTFQGGDPNIEPPRPRTELDPSRTLASNRTANS